jgi:hypothetical protein
MAQQAPMESRICCGITHFACVKSAVRVTVTVYLALCTCIGSAVSGKAGFYESRICCGTECAVSGTTCFGQATFTLCTIRGITHYVFINSEISGIAFSCCAACSMHQKSRQRHNLFLLNSMRHLWRHMLRLHQPCRQWYTLLCFTCLRCGTTCACIRSAVSGTTRPGRATCYFCGKSAVSGKTCSR